METKEPFSNASVAATFRIGPKKFMEWLRVNKIFNSHNFPNPRYDGKGYFVVKAAQRWDIMTTYWTQAGVDVLRPLVLDAIGNGELRVLKPVQFDPDSDNFTCIDID